jgi:hypothetical protein
MAFSKQSIFRESAVQKYLQRQEQGVLLRAISPPMFALFWILLLFLLSAGILAWCVQVPVSIAGQGVVVAQNTAGSAGEVVAALFFAPDRRADLRIGQPVTITIGPGTSRLTSSIERVETNVISPDDARTRFGLQGSLTQVITAPSVIVYAQLGSAASASIYAGSLCAAQVQIGSQRVLSLFPGFN